MGLLAARGKDLYGFLHLTFQEYLVGLSLIQNEATAADKLLAKVGDPRWREPLLLALGYAGVTWERDTFQRLLLSLLQADQSEMLIPRNTFLIVTALSEIKNIPISVVRTLTENLLNIYADRKGLGRFEPLRKQIEQAFLQLQEGNKASVVEQTLQEAIISHHPELALAAATLIQKHAWFTIDLVRALLKALPYDRADWNWPINQALANFMTRLTFNSQTVNQTLTVDMVQRQSWLSPEMKQRLRQFHINDEQQSRQTQKALPDDTSAIFRVISRDLPFRFALEQEPGLVEFIVNDYLWLRLVIALYGGLGHYNIAHTLDEYVQVNQQFQFGGADTETRRESAIRLDTEIQPKLKKLQKLKPTFEVKHIYRDSPLTSYILPILKERQPVSRLINTFWQLWQQSEQISLQAEALVALSALGEDVTEPLAVVLDNSTTNPIGQMVLTRLSYLADSLQDAVIRIRKYLPELFKEATSTLSAEQQVDAIAAAIEIVVTYGGEPITTIELLDSFPLPQQTYLLAEFWSFSFAGVSPDTIYNIAVTLDASGKKLTTPPELLVGSFVAVHTARNNLWPHHQGWTPEKLPSRLTNQAELIVEAMAAFGNIPNELAFVRGWALGCLKPFLTTNYTDLMPEALTLALTTLSDNDSFATQTDALTELAPQLIGHPHPLLEVLNATQAIKNPFHRSRALWRLAPHFQEQYNQLLTQALSAAREITDSYQKTRALEQLLPTFPQQQTELLNETLIAARQIKDVNNKARALSRLAMYFSSERRIELLTEALQTVEVMSRLKELQGQGANYYIQKLKGILINTKKDSSQKIDSLPVESLISWERELAETLKLLKPYVVTYPKLFERWQKIIEGIRNEWQRDVACSRLAPLLMKYQASLTKLPTEMGHLWAVITLAAITRDLQDHKAKPQRLERLWSHLANTQSQEILESLLAQGAAEGLALTQTAVNTLDILMYRQSWPQVHALLPLLHKPDPEVIPTIYQWLTINELASYAALLLAETEGLTPQIVPKLMELLGSDNDRLRHRAALTLHGRDRTPRLASELGQKTIEALAYEGRRYRLLSPRKSLVIHWGFERIVFDVPEMIITWANILATGAEGSEEAEWILQDIQGVTPQAWIAFYQILQQGSPTVQQCLLESLIRLQITQWSKPDKWQLPQANFQELISVIYKLSLQGADKVRPLALEAIGFLGREEEDIAVLVEAIYSNIEQDMQSALIALGRLTGRVVRTIKTNFNIVIIQQALKVEDKQETIDRLETEVEELKLQFKKVKIWQSILVPYLKDERSKVAKAAAEAMVRSGLEPDQLIAALEGDKVRTLSALLDACNTRYVSSEYEQTVQNAGTFVERHPYLLEVLVRRLADKLTEDITDTPLDWLRSNLLDVTAVASARMPASFANIANKLGLQDLLIEAVEHHNTFPGRRAAIILLSFLRQMTPKSAIALRLALQDVFDVQNGALQAATRLTNIDEDFLPILCDGLYQESAVAAYTTAQILTIIGRNEKTTSEQRLEILAALSEVINDSRSKRHVYIIGGSGGSGPDAFYIKYIGRLDQLFYQNLTQIAGVDSMQARHDKTVQIASSSRVRRYTIPCTIAGEDSSTEIYLGDINAEDHPIQYQSGWFSKEKTGGINQEVMAVLEKLRDIALEHNLPFTQLVDCVIEISKREIHITNSEA